MPIFCLFPLLFFPCFYHPLPSSQFSIMIFYQLISIYCLNSSAIFVGFFFRKASPIFWNVASLITKYRRWVFYSLFCILWFLCARLIVQNLISKALLDTLYFFLHPSSCIFAPARSLSFQILLKFPTISHLFLPQQKLFFHPVLLSFFDKNLTYFW